MGIFTSPAVQPQHHTPASWGLKKMFHSHPSAIGQTLQRQASFNAPENQREVFLRFQTIPPAPASNTNPAVEGSGTLAMRNPMMLVTADERSL